MQWILQDFEDTQKLSVALDTLGLPYTWHKVVPFSGDLMPEPTVTNPNAVVMFGTYSLWKHAQARGYSPGVFVVEPFLHETVWHPHLLNGQAATILTVQALVDSLPDNDHLYFVRPVSDAKEIAGTVMTAAELLARLRKVVAIDPEDIPLGSLRHDTEMMLTEPVTILQEWRLWVVDGRVVTYSLYKDRSGVVYRPEIDDDALAFGQQMADLNQDYATAYVLDVCRTDDGLHLLETNCLNAAGFYAADLERLAAAIEALTP